MAYCPADVSNHFHFLVPVLLLDDEPSKEVQLESDKLTQAANDKEYTHAFFSPGQMLKVSTSKHSKEMIETIA